MVYPGVLNSCSCDQRLLTFAGLGARFWCVYLPEVNSGDYGGDVCYEHYIHVDVQRLSKFREAVPVSMDF